MTRESLWQAMMSLDEAYLAAGLDSMAADPLGEDSEAQFADQVHSLTGVEASYEALLWLRWRGDSGSLIAPDTASITRKGAETAYSLLTHFEMTSRVPEWEARMVGYPLLPILTFAGGASYPVMLWLDREESPLAAIGDQVVESLYTVGDVQVPTLEEWLRELASAVLSIPAGGNRLWVIGGELYADDWSKWYPWPGSE